MKQVVPVDFDPFAPDQEQSQTKGAVSKAEATGSSPGHINLEITLSQEVMSAINKLIGAQQKLMGVQQELLASTEKSRLATEQNQERIMELLEKITKPKKIKLIRDTNGMTSTALVEHDNPERLN